METAAGMKSGEVVLRPARTEDAPELGRICYEAFKTISEAHGFAADFPSVDVATGLMTTLMSVPGMYGVAAEDGTGKILGSNFMWEGDPVAGIGPITVDPAAQNASVGRRLMEHALRRADENGTLSVRLVQAAFHNRSLSLYTKLGFDTVEPLSLINGPVVNATIDGYRVRPMTMDDLGAVDKVTRQIHGHSRRNEIAGAVHQGTARVVEHDGRITGYTTVLGFFGHTAGESNEELKALVGAGEPIAGNGFLLPTRNSELMRWCFDHGLRVIEPMTLMSRGLYQEPRGSFIPSILF